MVGNWVKGRVSAESQVGRSSPDLQVEELSIDTGIDSLEIGVWGDDSLFKDHDRFDQACNSAASLEVTNVPFDRSSGNVYRMSVDEAPARLCREPRTYM